jgi:hypothetical protein
MRATGARRVAKGLAFLAAIVVPAIGHAAPAAVDPARGSDPSALTASIRIDGPPLRVSLQPAGRAARVGFVAAAGQRLGFGIAGVRFTPASAAALVVTVRQPDGSMVPGTSRVHCFAAKGTEPVCDGELTTRQAGRHVLEIDAPFSAAATLELVLSSPVAADLQAGKSHTIAVSRAGQDARLQLSLEPGADLSISAWGAGTQAAGQGAFDLRAYHGILHRRGRHSAVRGVGHRGTGAHDRGAGPRPRPRRGLWQLGHRAAQARWRPRGIP